MSSRERVPGLCPFGVASLALAAVCATGCSRDWDSYDPRLGASSSTATSGGGSGGQAGGSMGMGGATTTGAGGGGAGSGGQGGGGQGGGVPVLKCTPAGVPPLIDTFSAAAIDPAWIVNASGGATVKLIAGEIHVDLPTGVPDTYGGLASVSMFNMSRCAVIVEVNDTPPAATPTYSALFAGPDDKNYVSISKEGDMLVFYKALAGTETEVASILYDPIAHDMWRIREDSGVTYWETSDGTTWKTQTSAPNPVDLSAAVLGFGAGAYMLLTTATDADFDNFDVD